MAFVYLLSFFREMLSCSDKNKLTPEKVSEILCECLVREDRYVKGVVKRARGKNLVHATTIDQRFKPAGAIKEKRRDS